MLSNIKDEDYTRDGYLRFSYGFIGIKNNAPYWHSDLDTIRDKADPVINTELLKESLELKEILEGSE